VATAAACEDPGAGKPTATVQEADLGGGTLQETSPAAAAAPPPGAPVPSNARPPLAVPPGGVAFDGRSGTIGFIGTKVTGKHDGGFKEFTGAIALEGNLFKGVAVVIDMTSVWSDDERLTRHLKNADFFAVDRHPTATFVTTAVEEGGHDGPTHFVTGNLTLRGVTKSVTFPIELRLSPETATVKAEFNLNRQDFGITYPGKPDNLIRDNVLLRIDIQAPRAIGGGTP
jgi:polyisoprenoid-binding protein YceI